MTPVLLAARYGHKVVVQELCEIFGADILHRKKVRAMQTVSGSDGSNHNVWLHSQDDCQPAIVCEVAITASGSSVCARRGTFVEYCDIFVLYLLLPGTNWWACAHIVLEECAYCTLLWHENRELYELCIHG